MSQEHPKKKLASLEANARKSFSQNFLTSPHWVEKLATASIDPAADVIWEVGPGLGAITKKILEHAKCPVRLFEIDRKLAANLRQEHPNVPIQEGDFLETDIVKEAEGKKVSLLSNLPYHISTPILFMLLEHRVHFARLVLTFQREVAERVKARPRTSDYGALSVLVQTCFEIESLGIIPPGAFYPAPKVDSEALLLRPKPAGRVPYENLRKLVKQAFLHRRKKLSSNISNLADKERILKALTGLNHTENARPEELSPKDFETLVLELL